jgi:polysaccharide chain length determinant protein (PEP-CTERM system associated)
MEIINRFNLYAEDRKRLPIEEIINNMREDDIKFAPITANVISPRTGRSGAATIAFTVSYEGKDPAVVQQVANVLASLYLEENIKVVGQQTENTTKFLEDEMRAVQNELSEIDRKIAWYKQSHNVALPELYQYNLQTLDRTETDIDRLKDQLQALREKETYLRGQLTGASISISQDEARLKELREKLAALQAQYSDAYPDVVNIKKEIATLEKRVKGSSKGEAQKPDNPAYLNMAAELAATQSNIKSVNEQISDLVNKKDSYRRRLEKSPNVEEGYKSLQMVRDNVRAKYDDLARKFMEARVAGGLEKGQLGERFTLNNPAMFPEKPVKPPRLTIILLGFILAIGAGVGTAALQEVSDHSARSSEDITQTFQFPVLAEIPQIAAPGEEQQRRRRFRRAAIAIIIAFIILILAVHFFIMDLDVLWARMVRRLNLLGII